MPKLTIDRTTITAPDGSTILQAADAAGIYIPRLCSHPDIPPVDPAELKPWTEVYQGAHHRPHASPCDSDYDGCRLCLVQVEGQPERSAHASHRLLKA